MFVTPQDFIDLPYNLPKMTDAPTQAALTAFINRNEPIELRRVLGGNFYNSMVTGIKALPASYVQATVYGIGAQVLFGSDIYTSLTIGNVGNQPDINPLSWAIQPANRWAKLSIGTDYLDINGATENWAGMKELVRPMIYGLWLRDDIDTSVQSSGVIQQTSENAKAITSAIRFSDALENYCLLVGGECQSEVDTLYNYLYNNSALFDDIPTPIPMLGSDFKNYLKVYFTNPGFTNDFL